MRLGLAHVARLGRAVQAVMRLGDINPDHADRIVRARRQHRFAVAGLGVPEQLGVVVEGGIARDPEDLPLPDRERVMLAARRHRELRVDLAVRIEQPQRGVGFVDHQLAGLGQRRDRDVRYLDHTAGLAEVHAGVERLQQFGRGVEALAQCLFHGAEPERLQLRLRGGPFRKRLERAGDVVCGERVARQRRRGIGLQRLPGGIVQFAGDLQPARGLEAGDGAFLIGAELAIDLPGREVRTIQQDLRMQVRTQAGLQRCFLRGAGGRGCRCRLRHCPAR
ncbi:hypothetical protein D3C71_1166330 [compost metagenome]